MTEINSVGALNATTATTATSATTSSKKPQVVFDQFPSLESFERTNVHDSVKKFLETNKGNIEVDTSWYHIFVGNDHITFTPNGKITYGQLRENLGIPPKILSTTNNKKLTDDQEIKEPVKINIDDIGWYAQQDLYPEERAVNQSLRDGGVLTAGYDRAVKSEDIVNWLK